jgi:hypothetical protein
MSYLIDFRGKIMSIQSLMNKVSTGKAERKDKEAEYEEIRKQLKEYFLKFGITDPNPFSSLEDFYGYYNLKMEHWAERRDFVRQMYERVEQAIDNALKKGGGIEIDNETVQNQKPKILFLAANPKDAVKLRLGEEVREIEQKIMLAQQKDNVDLVNKGAVRIGDLQLYLTQERPNIVHFCGHGTEEGEIILEDILGKARTVPPEALTRLFQSLTDNVHVVLLNACFSLEQAHAISQHVDCVIGMSSSISDEAAIAFGSAFYQALALEKSVKEAFDQGITELMLWRIPEEHIPQLLVRTGVDPSRVFLFQTKSQAARAKVLATLKSGDGELVDCGFCKGTGWVHSSTSIFGEKCPVCGGVGKKRV